MFVGTKRKSHTARNNLYYLNPGRAFDTSIKYIGLEEENFSSFNYVYIR